MPKKSTLKNSFDYRLLAIFVLLALTQIVLLNFSKCVIYGQSMNDTYFGTVRGQPERDSVVLSAYIGTLKYKDIVVIAQPGFADPIIKRVIAVEGESIRFVVDENDITIVHLQKLQGTEWVDVQEDYIRNGEMSLFSKPMYEYGEVITIPTGHIFVMGDNRDNSTDSREFGTAEVQNVQGKVVGTTAMGRDFTLYKNALITLNLISVLFYGVLGQLEERKRTLLDAMLDYIELY